MNKDEKRLITVGPLPLYVWKQVLSAVSVREDYQRHYPTAKAYPSTPRRIESLQIAREAIKRSMEK